MHVPWILAVWIVLCAAIQGPPPPRQLPPVGTTATSSATQVISPVALMTWVTRLGHDGVHTLDLVVVWRGAPGWFMRGGPQRSSSGGGTESFQSTARYGDVEVQVTLQTAKRIAEVQGQKVELGDANVILVDGVDTDAATVVRTLRIDPAVPFSQDGRPRVEEVLRRSPEIIAFLQCQTAMPDGRGQAMIDVICARVIAKSQ